MQLDASGNLWVLASGKPAYTGDETAGVLTKINTVTNEVDNNIQFETTQHPSSLNLDGGILYYRLGDTVFEQSLSATSLNMEPSWKASVFYTMVVNNGRLYGTDAGDYASMERLQFMI